MSLSLLQYGSGGGSGVAAGGAPSALLSVNKALLAAPPDALRLLTGVVGLERRTSGTSGMSGTAAPPQDMRGAVPAVLWHPGLAWGLSLGEREACELGDGGRVSGEGGGDGGGGAAGGAVEGAGAQVVLGGRASEALPCRAVDGALMDAAARVVRRGRRAMLAGLLGVEAGELGAALEQYERLRG
eukprot:365251-Chlamydomonas_euryale.AAC.14